MHIGPNAIGYLLGAGAIFVVASAYPNGRTSPRPSEMSVVKAICEERSKEDRHEIFRARVVGSEGAADTLNVRIGNATEQMAIARVKSVTFLQDRVDASGFLSATLIRDDDNREMVAMVQVRSPKSTLRLTGFRSDGASVGIELLRCRKVTFAAGAQSASDPGNPRPPAAAQ